MKKVDSLFFGFVENLYLFQFTTSGFFYFSKNLYLFIFYASQGPNHQPTSFHTKNRYVTDPLTLETIFHETHLP